MAYKTILVHVDRTAQATGCVQAAAALALAHQAHLVGSAMTGISRFAYVDHGILFEKEIQALTDRAEEALNHFEEICRQQGITSYEKRLIHDEAATGLTLQTPYADLVVVEQTVESIHLVSDLAEYVMLHAARPVLVVPTGGPTDVTGGSAVLAWNGTPEAVRAASFALPLLKRASNVTVALFQPADAVDAQQVQPGADVSLWLARHGVRVDLVHDRSGRHADDGLLALAAEKGARLIVMGGYGHARSREALLGGVTLKVLQRTGVPLLIAH